MTTDEESSEDEHIFRSIAADVSTSLQFEGSAGPQLSRLCQKAEGESLLQAETLKPKHQQKLWESLEARVAGCLEFRPANEAGIAVPPPKTSVGIRLFRSAPVSAQVPAAMQETQQADSPRIWAQQKTLSVSAKDIAAVVLEPQEILRGAAIARHLAESHIARPTGVVLDPRREKEHRICLPPSLHEGAYTGTPALEAEISEDTARRLQCQNLLRFPMSRDAQSKLISGRNKRRKGNDPKGVVNCSLSKRTQRVLRPDML